MDNLSIARQMEEANKTPKEIRLATGWERGKDKKWRYEINDYLQAVSDVYELQGKRKGVVNEKASLFGSKELNKAYPELENVQVKITISDDAKNNGSYEKLFINGKKDSSQITINATDVSKAQSILLHEMQHAIQAIEGFAKGGNVNQFKNTQNLFSELKERLELIIQVDKLSKQNNTTPKNFVENSGYKEWEKEYLSNYYDSDSNWDYVVNIAKDKLLSPEEKYKRLAGEVESRNVQSRMNMTPEQRRETLLTETEDVAREDQIVMMDGVEQAMSLSETKPITQAQSKTLIDWLNKAFGGKVRLFSDWSRFIEQNKA